MRDFDPPKKRRPRWRLTHKDLVPTKGIRTTYGSPIYADEIPNEDGLIVQRLRQGGAITIGNLACSLVTGLVYGSTDAGHLFAFCPQQRRVVQRWEMNDAGTPLMGIPEAHGILHLTCGRDGDIYGVTRREVFKLDVTTDRVIYLDKAPIPDLCQQRFRCPDIA